MNTAIKRYNDIKQYHDDDNSDAWRLMLLLKSENEDLKMTIQALCKLNLKMSKTCDIENCKHCFVTEVLG